MGDREQELDQARHDILRYANCWEDADLLLKAVGQQPGRKILSIASAGDNTLSLLCTQPELVVAVDLNLVQLYLLELKRAAISRLDYPDFLRLLGFAPTDGRKSLLHYLKKDMSSSAFAYWEKQPAINSGLIYQGKFERYFRLFVRFCLPLIHSQKKVERLLTEKSAQEQMEFYDRKWNTWRWKALFRIFFSRLVMGRLGRDPVFLDQVAVPVGRFIFLQAEKHLKSTQAQKNHFLRFTLTGNFGDQLPHYAREENFKLIKENLKALELKQGYAQIAARDLGPFDLFNLSNIFEYLNREHYLEVSNRLLSQANPNARFAYWNLMVPRRMSEDFPERLTYQQELSEKLTGEDLGFFYQRFLLDDHLS